MLASDHSANVNRDLAGGPLVSVIVPTYNYARFIGETLECLRAQTYSHWECVVVDDGSTDDTVERVAEFTARDARFKLIRQENARQAAAKNNGLRNSSGSFVQFLDADDLIEPEKLEKHVAYLEAHRDVDIVYGGMRYFNSDSPTERRHWIWGEDRPWMPETSGRGQEVLAALVRQNIMVINSPLLRRSVIDAVGPFDVALPPAEDWDYWLRCAAAGMSFQFEDSPGTMSLVRWHPLSSSQDRRRMYSSMLRIRTKINSLTEDAAILSLNRELAISDQETLALASIAHAPLGECLRQMLRAAQSSRNAKHRAKWFACTCMAPFVSRDRLRGLVTNSLTGPGGCGSEP